MTKHRIARILVAGVVGIAALTARNAAADEWHLTFAPYLWFVGMSGDVGVFDRKFDVDASFGDILDASDSLFAFNTEAELAYGRFALLFAPSYAKLGVDDVLDDTPFESDLTSELFFMNGAGAYRVVDVPTGETTPSGGESSTTIDVLAGFRYTYLENELDFDAGGSDSQHRDWWDPIIGGKAKVDLSGNWFLQLDADIGGFGAGSEFTALVTPWVGYRFAVGQGEAAVRAGYRTLYENYSDGGFDWDMTIHGFTLGLVTYWGG
jgi:hypothetical protein